MWFCALTCRYRRRGIASFFLTGSGLVWGGNVDNAVCIKYRAIAVPLPAKLKFR